MIGIITGALTDFNRPGHALVVIDLDDSAALELADRYLPPTGMEDGRASKSRSHRYSSRNSPATSSRMRREGRDSRPNMKTARATSSIVTPRRIGS